MLRKYIDGQYRQPSGIIGRWIGQKMVEQHQSENLWTVALLAIRPSDMILEVGYGAGFAVHEVAKSLTTGIMAGVDASKTMLHAARQRNSQFIRARRVDLRAGDVDQLPFSDNTFDKAFSIHSLYFWIDPLAGLTEIKRVLKPGGTLILTFLPTDRWNSDVVPTATPTFRPYSGSGLKDILAQVGFTNLLIEADPNIENRSNYSVIGQKA